MNKLVSSLFVGFLLALLTLPSSCSGTRTDSADEGGAGSSASSSSANPSTANPSSGNPGSADPAANPAKARPSEPARDAAQGQGAATQEAGQSQDDLLKQQRNFLIGESLKKARAAMANKDWVAAKKECVAILQLDPTVDEARRILVDAETYLGDRVPTTEQGHEAFVARAEVEKERARQLARDYERQGDFAMEKDEFDEAIQLYTRARYTIAYNPFFVAGSSEEKAVEAKIKNAEESKQRAAQRRAEAAEQTARTRLEQEERDLRNRREQKVRRLFQEANLAFQRERYGDAINLLSEALIDDPNNRNAQDMLALAQTARHDHNMEELKRNWRSKWVDTFDEINSSDIPQTDFIVHDLKHWKQVSSRQPIEFTSAEEADSPEDREVMKTLEDKRFPHQFAEATVKEWAAWYQQATGVNFLVSKKVEELPPDDSTLKGFNLPTMSVRQALDNIARITKVRWRVANGVVNLVTAEEGGGKAYLSYHDVRGLVSTVPSYPGRDITLRGHGEEEPQEATEEPTPTVLPDTQLVELIKENIGKDTWEGSGNSIQFQKGTLVVRHNRATHESIDKLLRDLRGSVGIQVHIESRFLRVEDNFLEDIGVDFRGLGAQQSEGVPGRGLEKQRPRPGFGFDDFGRRENISPSSPGEPGTGTEPGIFFDDGNDGDLFARTEHLYDRTLGGGAGGLDNSGGMSLQYAFLDDTELEVVFRAVSKQERVEEITAPQLLLYNTQRGNLTVTNQISYIRDFEVEIAQAAAVADPVVGVVKDGIVLDVRPVVSADRKFITMELRPTVANLSLPIPTFTTTLGVGQPISIQLPTLRVQKVRTTVTIPDGGTLMLGGMKMAEKQNYESGIPILSDLPLIGFLTSRKGTYIANKKVLILLKASILIPEEHEPILRDEDGQPITAARR
jgi:tetratricopeptide (TPR) repeat protein